MRDLTTHYRPSSLVKRQNRREAVLASALGSALFLVPLVFYLLDPFGSWIQPLLPYNDVPGLIVWGLVLLLCAVIGWRSARRTQQARDGIISSLVPASSIWITNAITFFIILDLFDADPNTALGVMHNWDQFSSEFQPRNLPTIILRCVFFVNDFNMQVVSIMCIVGFLLGVAASFLSAKHARSRRG